MAHMSKQMSKEEARETIAQACREQLEAWGYELVDAHWNRHRGGSTVQLVIHREGGATSGDCRTVYKRALPLLQAEGILDENGSLAVSTPGLDRPLRTGADFRRALGYKVVLRRRSAARPGAEERIIGKVEAVEDDSVTIAEKSGDLISTALADVIQGKFDI